MNTSFQVEGGVLSVIVTPSERVPRPDEPYLVDVYYRHVLFFTPHGQHPFLTHCIELEERTVEIDTGDHELPDEYTCEVRRQYGRHSGEQYWDLVSGEVRNELEYWDLTDGDYLWFAKQLYLHTTADDTLRALFHATGC